LKSFTNFINESVPNRKQGDVFKSFFRGTYASKKDKPKIDRAEGEIKKLSDTPYKDVPKNFTGTKPESFHMNFPNAVGRGSRKIHSTIDHTHGTLGTSSISDAIRGKKRELVSVNPSEIGAWQSLLKKKNKPNRDMSFANTLGHEATHIAQADRFRRGISGFKSKGQDMYDRSTGDFDFGTVEPSDARQVRKDLKTIKDKKNIRRFTDAAGKRRTTDDASYARHMIQNALKVSAKRRAAELRGSTRDAGHTAYENDPMEREARMVGAIAHHASALAANPTAQFPSYSDFRASTAPGKTNRSQEKTIRNAYKRMGMAFQNVSGRKVNPSAGDRDHLMRHMSK
jgi:hypothetical protein